MASVRMQIADAVEAKLAAVLAELGWETLIRNPREPVGEDQMNAIVLAIGGDEEPDSLTGHVAVHAMDIEVGLVVRESAIASAETLLDAGFVAVSDALLDPTDIQLGGLAQDIRRGAMSPPFVGRGEDGGRIIGVQSIAFTISYWAREGDASSPGP